MKFVGNRSFLLIKPKKPFVDWVNNYDDSIVPEDNIYSTRTLYMIEEFDDVSPEGIVKHLKKVYKDIFIHELWGWYMDENYLPKNISFKMFEEWFEYELIEMCFDTLKYKIALE